MSSIIMHLFPEFTTSTGHRVKTHNSFSIGIYDNEGSYVIESYFPGYPKSAINVEIDSGTLKVTAKNHDPLGYLKI